MKLKITLTSLITFLVTILTLTLSAQIPNSWSQKTDFGGSGRYGAISFTIGDKGYIGTGIGSGLYKDLWEYDPLTDSWTQKADFGGDARVSATSFAIGSKAYVGLGDNGTNPTVDFWEYDSSTNAWTQKADFPGTARYAAAGFSIGAKGYIGTGHLAGAGNRVKDFYEYDPISDNWSLLADVGGLPRAYAVGFTIGDKGYIGTGNSGILETDFWEFDPSTGNWTQKANFSGTGRFGACGFSNGTNGYIGLGDIGGGYSQDFWEYNPLTDSWIQKADFSGSKRTLSVGFNIENQGYIGTGVDETYAPQKDFYEYTPTCVPPTISAEPNSQSVTFGASASFTVSCSNAVSYQWQEDDGTGFVNISNGGLYSDATTTTLNISLPTVSMSGYKYRCVVTGSCLPTAVTNGNAVLNVSALSIVITPDAGQTKVYGSSDPTPFTYTFAPALVVPDVMTGLMGRLSGEDVGTYAFTLGTLSAGTNYTLSIAATPTFSITPLAITVTADPGQSKEYGSVDPVFSFTSVPSLISGDVFSGFLSRVSGESVGLYPITQGTLSAGTNYVLTFVSNSFNIIPKAILITANAGQAKIYGSADPTPFDYSFAPALIGTDLITGLLSRVSGENVGSYSYTIGTLTAGPNYSLSVNVNPTFNITAKDLTVLAEDKSKCYDGTIFSGGYTVLYHPMILGERLFLGVQQLVRLILVAIQ